MTDHAEPSTEMSTEMFALAIALGNVAAPCQTTDAGLWFAADPAPAIELCGDCHAVPECADLARANGESFGVWGGVDLERRGRRKEPAA